MQLEPVSNPSVCLALNSACLLGNAMSFRYRGVMGRHTLKIALIWYIILLGCAETDNQNTTLPEPSLDAGTADSSSATLDAGTGTQDQSF